MTGFLALCGMLVVIVIAHFGDDLRVVLDATAIVFFFGGFIRGKGRFENPWLKGLAVNSGGSVPVLVLSLTGQAFASWLFLVQFVLVSILFAITGVQVRCLWKLGHRWRGLVLAFVSMAAISIVTEMLVPSLMSRISTELMDRPAPSFSISSLDGRTISSSAMSGRIAVLSFWATWCLPCVHEIPVLQEVYMRYRGNPQVVFWAINTGREGDDVDKARDFAKAKGWDLPLAFDNQGAAQLLEVSGIPKLILLDKKGHIRLIHDGYDESEHLANSLSNNIERLLLED